MRGQKNWVFGWLASGAARPFTNGIEAGNMIRVAAYTGAMAMRMVSCKQLQVIMRSGRKKSGTYYIQERQWGS